MKSAQNQKENDIFWEKLPWQMQKSLFMGSEGKLHLLDLAEQALNNLNSSRENTIFFLELAMDLLLQAWLKEPFDGELASHLLTLNSKRPCLASNIIPALKVVSASSYQPQDLRYYQRLAEKREPDKTARFIRSQINKDPRNMYWWNQLYILACFEHDWQMAAEVLDQDWPEQLAFAKAKISADLAFFKGDPEQAAWHYQNCDFKQDAEANFRWGNMQALLGNWQAACKGWKKCLELYPWLVNEILCIYDRLCVNAHQSPLTGKISILLFTYNKAAELDITLQSLLNSNLGQSVIHVLNNASTDHTEEVLSKYQQKAGEHRLKYFSLPVNIGAPAARNWLLSLTQVKESDWILFMDDDATVAHDWLENLGQAVARYSDAGVWGCRVLDAHSPHLMQSVDLHLKSAQPVAEGQSSWQKRFELSDLHHQCLDFGQFSYVRPCISVTGCCHLFKAEDLLDSQGFDLRFSPTQYDDVEFDIRNALNDKYAVYQGHAEIRHMKKSGKASIKSTADYTNSYANLYKLHHKYTQDEYNRLMEQEAEILAEDFFYKAKEVWKALDI